MTSLAPSDSSSHDSWTSECFELHSVHNQDEIAGVISEKLRGRRVSLGVALSYINDRVDYNVRPIGVRRKPSKAKASIKPGVFAADDASLEYPAPKPWIFESKEIDTINTPFDDFGLFSFVDHKWESHVDRDWCVAPQLRKKTYIVKNSSGITKRTEVNIHNRKGTKLMSTTEVTDKHSFSEDNDTSLRSQTESQDDVPNADTPTQCLTEKEGESDHHPRSYRYNRRLNCPRKQTRLACRKGAILYRRARKIRHCLPDCPADSASFP